MIWRVLPFRSGNFQHILIQIPTPGISSTIFTQRLSADNLPSKGSSKSDGGLGASSAFRYTSANGDARVLSHYTCFSCTLTTFLVGKSLHCLLFSLIQQALGNCQLAIGNWQLPQNLPVAYLKLKAATAKHPQPTIKATPPRGVIAPSHLMSVKLRAYKLPEKMIVPAIKAHPATAKKV